jgi:competence protein CoiA
MKYAIVNEVKLEAFKGGEGTCPSCGSSVYARCGEKYINHWSHKGKRNCDPWWENETEWHRSWKNHFPIEWQEIVHFDEKGEKHIADVKVSGDWVVEFQHSFINPEEIQTRNKFYKRVSWVVDGLRRKRDLPQFEELIKDSRVLQFPKLEMVHLNVPEESRLISDWQGYQVPVFLDFYW